MAFPQNLRLEKLTAHDPLSKEGKRRLARIGLLIKAWPSPSRADSRNKCERKGSIYLPLFLVSSSNLCYNPVGQIPLSPVLQA